jgi:hypothetical protein
VHRQVTTGKRSPFRYEKLPKSSRESHPNRYLASNFDNNLSFTQPGQGQLHTASCSAMQKAASVI